MNPEATVYDVPGISCGHCKQTIETGLTGVDGVTAVSVDVEQKTVSVSGEIDQDTVRTALDGLGYEVTGTRGS